MSELPLYHIQYVGYEPPYACKTALISTVFSSAGNRSRANVAHVRQSRPDSGLDFQAKILSTF